MHHPLNTHVGFCFARRACVLLACAAALTISGALFAGPETINTGKNVKEVVAPPAPPPCNWTGFYFGANGGYGWGDTTTSSPDEGFGADESVQSLSLDPDGGVVGGQLGFNWQFGNHFVVGLEASGGRIGLQESKFIDEDPDDFIHVHYKWYALITPRLGVSVLNNRLLLYAKGGVAFVNLENHAGDLDGEVGHSHIDPTENSKKDDTEVGWTVGGGLEVALNCHWSIGVEYNYLGDLDRSSSHFNENLGETQHYHHDNDAHLVTARLSYKFWGGR